MTMSSSPLAREDQPLNYQASAGSLVVDEFRGRTVRGCRQGVLATGSQREGLAAAGKKVAMSGRKRRLAFCRLLNELIIRHFRAAPECQLGQWAT